MSEGIGDRAESEDDLKLLEVTRSFEQLMETCPPELRGRQRVLRERRGDYVFCQIVTSFRVAKDQGGI